MYDLDHGGWRLTWGIIHSLLRKRINKFKLNQKEVCVCFVINVSSR